MITLSKKNFDIVKYVPGYLLTTNIYNTKEIITKLRDDILDNQDIRKILREFYIMCSTEVHQDGGVGRVTYLTLKNYLDQKLVGIDIVNG